jgi:hypothetical protein
MNTATIDNGRVLWQEGTDDMPIAEPALLITGNADIVTVEQEGRYINLNYESVDEFIKVLREIKKHRPE